MQWRQHVRRAPCCHVLFCSTANCTLYTSLPFLSASRRRLAIFLSRRVRAAKRFVCEGSTLVHRWPGIMLRGRVLPNARSWYTCHRNTTRETGRERGHQSHPPPPSPPSPPCPSSYSAILHLASFIREQYFLHDAECQVQCKYCIVLRSTVDNSTGR